MAMSYVNTWIYKRTHTGDPNESGTFGCSNCMGEMRGYNYDSVIGVGGKNPWKRDQDIALKINWIGLGPTKRNKAEKGLQVTFKHFRLNAGSGPDLKAIAPKLFKYMFQDKNRRQVMAKNCPKNVQKEITKILNLAKKYPKSKGASSKNESRGKCK